MTINDYLKDSLFKMLDFRKAAGYATFTYTVTLMPFIDFSVRITGMQRT